MKAYNIETALRYKEIITELFIYNRPLATFPSWIFECPKLEILELAGNHLSDIPDLSRLSLRNVSFENNNLTTAPSLPLALTHLNLSGNRLSSIKNIGRYRSLQVLNVSKNVLKILPESINRLPELNSLLLSQNKINKIPRSISNLKSLKELNLSHNYVKKIPTDYFFEAPIQRIDVSKNKLKELHLFLPETIEHFDVSNNKLVELECRFNGIPLLSKMDASKNNLCSIPFWIQKCNFLRKLNLSKNNIKRFVLEEFPIQIKELSLDNNPIEEVTLNKPLASIEKLSLKKTQLDSIEHLYNYLPNCHISTNKDRTQLSAKQFDKLVLFVELHRLPYSFIPTATHLYQKWNRSAELFIDLNIRSLQMTQEIAYYLSIAPVKPIQHMGIHLLYTLFNQNLPLSNKGLLYCPSSLTRKPNIKRWLAQNVTNYTHQLTSNCTHVLLHPSKYLPEEIASKSFTFILASSIKSV